MYRAPRYRGGHLRGKGPACLATKGPMWGHPMLVLGALCSFLEPFYGNLSPKIDKVSEELTLRYPHEGPWVGVGASGSWCRVWPSDALAPTPHTLRWRHLTRAQTLIPKPGMGYTPPSEILVDKSPRPLMV